MTFPKIKWHVERNMYSSIWYTIVAEVDLGSARYTELRTISQNEIDELYSVRTLWKIIEKMQWNMLDALGYYDFDSPVSYDLEGMQAAIDSGTIVVPSGLTRDERREWIRNNKRMLVLNTNRRCWRI